MQYTREAPVDRPIFSNATRAIYIYTNHANYYYLVRELEAARRQVEKNMPDGAYVAWVYSLAGNYNYGIRELPGLEPVAELNDGVILKVNRAYDRADVLRTEYESIVSGEPAIRSVFDVYLVKNTLHYVKEQCCPADTEPRFFLHLIPADVNDLPEHRKKHTF